MASFGMAHKPKYPKVDDGRGAIGKIAICKDGYVGVVMDIDKDGNWLVDGDAVAPSDAKTCNGTEGGDWIPSMCRNLGITDDEAITGIKEAVRIIAEKKGILPEENNPLLYDDTEAQNNPLPASPEFGGGVDSTPSSDDTPLPTPSAAQSDSTPQEVDAVETIPYKKLMKMYESVALDLKVVHAENDKLKQQLAGESGVQSLRDELSREKQALIKAQAALIQAEKLFKEAQEAATLAREDAAGVRLELLALKKNAPSPALDTPSPISTQGNKPYDVKVCIKTTESQFEDMFAKNWMLEHTSFNEAGDCRTVWVKVNEPRRPDGSPIREAVEVPAAFDDTSEYESVGEIADVRAYVPVRTVAPSVNSVSLQTPPPGPLPEFKEGELPTPSPSPLHGEGDTAKIILAEYGMCDACGKWGVDASLTCIRCGAVEAPVIEVVIEDEFPRFENWLEGMPISQAIAEHGLEKTKEAMDAMTQIAVHQAVAGHRGKAAIPTIRKFENLLPEGAL